MYRKPPTSVRAGVVRDETGCGRDQKQSRQGCDQSRRFAQRRADGSHGRHDRAAAGRAVPRREVTAVTGHTAAMRRALGIGLALAAVPLASGCGSTHAKTVTVKPAASPEVPSAYVSEAAPVSGPYVSEPQTLTFSADGDLYAQGLHWSGWGQSVAIGTGTFIFRDYPSDARAAVPGTVTLSLPVKCSGKTYYSAAVVHAPGGPFPTGNATPFDTPCTPLG